MRWFLAGLLCLCAAGAFAQFSGSPHLNPVPGDVWTYFGPTLGGGWGAPQGGGGGGGQLLTGGVNLMTGNTNLMTQ